MKERKETLLAGNAVGLLAGVGHACRVHQRSNDAVQKIEDMIRSSIEKFLTKFEQFMDQSDLLGRAQLLPKTLNRIRLLDFYHDRDDLELAWHIASEYSDDEKPRNWKVIGKVRDFLDRVDDEILFEEQLVKQLQEIGRLEQEGQLQEIGRPVQFDPDYFWWLSASAELPQLRCEQYLAGYIDGMLVESLRVKFEQYLLAHPELQEQEQIIRKTLSQL